LIHSLSTIGFAQIVGHGIPEEVIQELFQMSNQFFTMDASHKHQYVSKDKARRGNKNYTV
jgi:isopenicillin N synthase-like dioxygenase